MTAAETILRAAKLMRQRAQAAIDASGPTAPWHDAADLDSSITRAYDEINAEDAAHIAGMSPHVALAVAAWLRAHGEELARSEHPDECGSPNDLLAALRIAQAYLGGEA